MTRYIILSKREMTATALKQVLSLVDIQSRPEYEEIICDNGKFDLAAYRSIAGRIETIASGTDGFISSCETVVLVDQADPNKLNPIDSNGWDSIIAMLILSFPEIRWVFGIFSGNIEKFKVVARNHNLLSLFEAAANPLFDGTGLRNWVRKILKKNDENRADDKKMMGNLPVRKNVAIAIDEEQSCAYFHAYVAYRFGFRSYAVMEEALMKKLVGRKGQLNGKSIFHLSMEDIFLNFPDQSAEFRKIPLSDLEVRSKHFPGLNPNPGFDKNHPFRVFITSGQKQGTTDVRRKNNELFTDKLRDNEQRLGTVMHKPLSGIFDVWKKSGLIGKSNNGLAKGFIWPPNDVDINEEPACLTFNSNCFPYTVLTYRVKNKIQWWYYLHQADGQDEKTDICGHGAPGRILEIASRLEARAEKLRENTHSTIRAIHGAVLAVDAMELLGEKAQTTFFEALALKHEFEAIAECHFYGVHSHFDVEERIKEIQTEAEVFSKYFNDIKQKDIKLNTEVTILDRLIRIYRGFNQFDEEMCILNRSREIHHLIWFKKNCWFWRITYPVVWYIQLLLKSIRKFLGISVLWSIVFGVFFMITNPLICNTYSGFFTKAIPAAIITFLSIGNTVYGGNIPEKSPYYVFVICLAVVLGLMHFGVLISHIYSRMSRR